VPGCPEDYPCGPFVECDVTEGAGRDDHGNFGASNKRCELATEHRYITTADDGHARGVVRLHRHARRGPEDPGGGAMMVSALEPDLLEGGCNAGFVRPDALLVVVVVQASQDNG
jgi:hypothetical protein